MSKAQELVERGEQAVAPVNEPTGLMEGIIRAASDPHTDVEKLERLMAMHERMEARNAEHEFNRAMSRCQKQMGRISADATNPQTRSKYATYAQLDRALRPIYTAEGLSLSFDTGDAPAENYVRVLCYVSHEAGHSRTYRADMPADGKGAKGNDVMTKTHAAGSAMSYGSRYLLKLIFNVAVGEDDDDGNKAGASAPKITDKQKSTLVDLIAATETDETKFLRWVFPPDNRDGLTLDDIPASMYAKCETQLKRKLKASKEGGR